MFLAFFGALCRKGDWSIFFRAWCRKHRRSIGSRALQNNDQWFLAATNKRNMFFDHMVPAGQYHFTHKTSNNWQSNINYAFPSRLIQYLVELHWPTRSLDFTCPDLFFWVSFPYQITCLLEHAIDRT